MQNSWTPLYTGANPGFFLGGGARLRNDVTDGWGKQILKVNTKKKTSSQGGAHPLHPPPRSALVIAPRVWDLGRYSKLFFMYNSYGGTLPNNNK